MRSSMDQGTKARLRLMLQSERASGLRQLGPANWNVAADAQIAAVAPVGFALWTDPRETVRNADTVQSRIKLRELSEATHPANALPVAEQSAATTSEGFT